jgi:ketosteroid isomerase-like protein
MSTHQSTPAGTVERFSELLSAGHIDELLELYEGDAAFVPEPGRTVVGTRSIRAELERFAALKPRMTGSVEKVVETGDTALVAYRWRLEGTGPDGSHVDLAATSADVLRRRPDGSWGVLIDDPWGATSAA